jgi:predicted phosphodiesterase
VILCAAGDIHGGLDRMYAGVLAFEAALSVRFDWVLHVGDFGVWPNPDRVDGATRRHDGAGDFAAWFAEQRRAPRPTLFIKGNHEDFVWLDEQPSSEVLPDLHYLRNGQVFELRAGSEVLRVGGIGGCFGPSNFERLSATLQGGSKRHYTRDEISLLSGQTNLDIVLTHDAPAGVRFGRHRRGEGFISEAAGLDELLAKTKPRVCFFGHHHSRVDATVGGVSCVGLNKGHYPGCLVAFDMRPGERSWRILGEWPEARASE